LTKARKKVLLQSSAAIKNKPKDDRTEDQIVGCPLKVECLVTLEWYTVIMLEPNLYLSLVDNI